MISIDRLMRCAGNPLPESALSVDWGTRENQGDLIAVHISHYQRIIDSDCRHRTSSLDRRALTFLWSICQWAPHSSFSIAFSEVLRTRPKVGNAGFAAAPCLSARAKMAHATQVTGGDMSQRRGRPEKCILTGVTSHTALQDFDGDTMITHNLSSIREIVVQ